MRNLAGKIKHAEKVRAEHRAANRFRGRPNLDREKEKEQWKKLYGGK